LLQPTMLGWVPEQFFLEAWCHYSFKIFRWIKQMREPIIALLPCAVQVVVIL
jgi:hypothetical protein